MRTLLLFAVAVGRVSPEFVEGRNPTPQPHVGLRLS